MITVSQFIAIALFAVLGILIPCLLPVLIQKKYIKIKMAPLFVGAGIFIFFVLLLESLMHFYFLKTNTYTKSVLENPWIYAIYASLAAAFFEETGRLIAFKFILKKYRTAADGIAYGLGHGGIEFLLIGGIGAINILVMAVLINHNGFDVLLNAKNIPVNQIKEIKNSVLDVDFTNVLLGLFERSMALIMQVGMTMMVFYAVVTRKYKFYFFAVLFHLSADFCAALAQKGIISPVWIVELIIIPFAIAGIVIARNLYRKLKVMEKVDKNLF
jgi:uncharacterized membrane protein YhfC